MNLWWLVVHWTFRLPMKLESNFIIFFIENAVCEMVAICTGLNMLNIFTWMNTPKFWGNFHRAQFSYEGTILKSFGTWFAAVYGSQWERYTTPMLTHGFLVTNISLAEAFFMISEISACPQLIITNITKIMFPSAESGMSTWVTDNRNWIIHKFGVQWKDLANVLITTLSRPFLSRYDV